MHDVNRDSCADLVMAHGAVRIESPLVSRNDGSRFRAMSPVPFVGSSRELWGVVPADENGDGAIDFIVRYTIDGPDHEYGTPDDLALFVTLLNTTPPRHHPLRRPGEPAAGAGGDPAEPDSGTGRHADRGRVAGVHRP